MERTEIRVEKGIQGEVGFFKVSCIFRNPSQNKSPNQVSTVSIIHDSLLNMKKKKNEKEGVISIFENSFENYFSFLS